MNKLRVTLLAALLTVASGSHAATFNLFSPANGILKGNPSTYVTTAAVSADVISLWTGTCNASTFLRGDGSCQTPAGGSPGGSTTQVQYNNAGAFAGSAAFTWNNATATLNLEAAAPVLQLWETGATADEGRWAIKADNDQLAISAVADDGSPGDDAFLLVRDGAAVNNVEIYASEQISAYTNFQVVDGELKVSTSGARFIQDDTGSPADNQKWMTTADSSELVFAVFNDAENMSSQWMSVQRTGTSVDSVNIFGGLLTLAPDELTISTNGTDRITFDTDGSWDLAGTTPGSSGQVLTSNGAGAAPTWQAAAAGAGGSTTQVQYNNAGALAGDAGMTYNAGTDTLSVGVATITTSATINSLAVVTRETTINNFGSVATGCTSGNLPSFRATRTGSLVTINSVGFTCTSNGTSFNTTDALPVAYRPSGTVNYVVIPSCTDNGTATYGNCSISVNSGGIISFLRNSSASGWTNSGTKGIGPFTVTFDAQ